MAIFTLKVKESWKNKSGQKQARDNLIKMESLSKNAYWVRDNVKVGKRYYVDGYIRTDNINGVDETKVRILHITEEDSEDFAEGKKMGSKEALQQAFAIVDNSVDLTAAKAKLRLVLS